MICSSLRDPVIIIASDLAVKGLFCSSVFVNRVIACASQKMCSFSTGSENFDRGRRGFKVNESFSFQLVIFYLACLNISMNISGSSGG